MIKEINPGQWLHTSCSDEWYEVLAVGTDDNGAATIDISMPDINEFMDARWDDGDDIGPTPSLMRVEPCAVVFRGLQWKPVENHESMITCNTPGRGCYRCTELFTVYDKRCP
jgi:hypothetical protein